MSAIESCLEKLTEKQQIFVMEYAADGNGVRACREAGYKGTSPALGVRAASLLKNPKVKRALDEVKRPYMEAAQINIATILDQMRRFLFRNILPYLDEEGRLTCDLSELPEDVQQCIESIKVKRRKRWDDYEQAEIEDEQIDLTFVSKAKTLELAMKHLGMLQPDNVTNVAVFPWEQLYQMVEKEENVHDPIEQKLLSAENGGDDE